MSWTIKLKLTCGFGIAILMLLACTLFAWHGISSATAAAVEVQKDYATVEEVEHFVSLAREITSEQRAYLISGDEKSIANLPVIRQDLDATNSALEKHLAGTPEADTMAQMKDVMLQRRTVVNEMLTAFKSQGFEAAKALFATGQDNLLLYKMLGLAEDLKQQEKAKLETAQKRQEQTRTQTIGFLLAACIAAAAVMVMVGFLITRSIKQNLQISIDMLDAMTRKNLAIPDGIPHSNDELSHAILAINGLKGSMHRMIGTMANAATEVAGAGTEISHTSSEIANSVDAERREVEHIASALHEMTITVQDVASNSHDAAKAAEQAVSAAETGGHVVLGAVETMQRIAQTVGQAAADITKLGKETEGIGSVVSLIEDIATQTNLLALNATIEAARAGEQGKGFAVVASEVRRLAERTAEFTKEIANKISNVQHDAETAVRSMRQGKEDVDLGVTRASEARSSLNDILKAIGEAKERIAMIATATSEQSAATGELSMNVERISTQVITTSQGAEHNAQACAELAKLAESLHAIVHEFHLSDHNDRSTWNRSLEAAATVHRSDSTAMTPSYSLSQL